MQKAILGYGKTVGGKYRPLLVDDTGRLVIEVGDAVVQAVGELGARVDGKAIASAKNEVENGADVWVEHMFCFNANTVDEHIKIGSTKGGDDVVKNTLVKRGTGVLLRIDSRPATVWHATATAPMSLNVYTRKFRRTPA